MRLVDDDIWAIMTIAQEASNQPFEGKVAVAEVIRNRMMHKYDSDGTAAGTVLQPFQFSGWNTSDPNRLRCALLDDQDSMVKECIRAWNTAVQQDTQSVNGAVLYYNPKSVAHDPSWLAASMKVASVGAHDFYLPTSWT